MNFLLNHRRLRPGSASNRPGTSPRVVQIVAVSGSLISAGAALTPAALAAGQPTIQITTERDIIRADGRSTTLISVQVRDDRGVFVPDGTRVRFSTTAGQLENSIVETQGGIARVTLTAANLPGVALITINLEGVPQAAQTNTRITFTSDADPAETGTSWVKINGAYVAYLTDYHVIQANGKRDKSKARFEYRSLVVSADSLQLDVQSNLLQAVGNVVVTQANGPELTFNALRYDLAQSQGSAERLDEGRATPVLLTGTGGQIVTSEVPADSPPMNRSAWELKDVSDSNVAIVARSIALNPNNQIQFIRATFYINGTNTVSLPRHVMELKQGQLFREQIIGLGPNGVSVDLPLYYDMRPNGIGTLHVRRGAQVGTSAYSVRPGWRADLEQSYNGKNGVEGLVEVNNLAQGDWGARLRHSQRLGPTTRGSLFVDFPNNRDLFLTSQVSRTFKTFSVNAIG
ncbi:MAG: Ig-like domain-containing protein, partial [Armatimonadota bacterium]